MGTPMLAGREFTDQDNIDGPSVGVVNHSFVEKFSPNQNVLGREYNVCWTVHNPVKIVGIVADARQTELQDEPRPTIFIDNTQAPMYFASIVVRAQGDPREIMRTAEAAIRRVDPDQAVSDVQTMANVFSDSVSAPRFQMLLLLVFAGLALALAVIGIYGVVSNSVSQRVREIGIRAALGASASRIVRMIVLEAVVLAAVAIAIGIAASLALTRLLEALLFETSPTDLPTLLIGSCAVLLVAIFSALLPARRAMRVDPMVALRHE
jgi:putative ABC transport system permease protein